MSSGRAICASVRSRRNAASSDGSRSVPTAGPARDDPGPAAARYCLASERPWFRRHGFEWRAFLERGIDVERLRELVRTGGWLAIMTCFQTDDARLAAWPYRKDPTHVVFYRKATFRHLADVWGWACEVPVKDVALLRRPLAHA